MSETAHTGTAFELSPAPEVAPVIDTSAQPIVLGAEDTAAIAPASRRARRAAGPARPVLDEPHAELVDAAVAAVAEAMLTGQAAVAGAETPVAGVVPVVPVPVVAVKPVEVAAAAEVAVPVEVAAPVPAAVLPQAPGRRARRARPVEPVLAPAEPFELIEPEVDREPVTERVIEQEPAGQVLDQPAPSRPSSIDEFAAAVALFSFTGEAPVQSPVRSVAPEPVSAQSAATAHAVPRTFRGRSALKSLATASFSVGVMGIVGLMTVGMTTPAEAVAAATGNPAATAIVAPADSGVDIQPDEIQAYVAPAGTESADVVRSENYDTLTMAEIASESGIQNFSNFFKNDPNSAIQWPFAVGVPITYGFGMRSGRMHEGVDFTPGAGSPIQAIADGVVREATAAGGAYGVHVIIDHEIDGQLVSSHYAHMEYGSLKVVPGQKVTVGTILGTTGNTGRSFGAHTHFEILMNGTTAIDPIPWLRQHAGG
ncbi:hypothetical protein GCM10027411_10490 [Microbacterium aureliae]